MRYVQLTTDQIPVGKAALLLFIHKADLCAGIVEHRCDGRFERRVPEHPSPTDLMPMICTLLTGKSDDKLFVVIEDFAYWPEAFPSIEVQSRHL